MKGTIKLDNPIKVNGKNIKTLTYDTSEITAAMFVEADTRKLRAGSTGNGIAVSAAAEVDYGLHLYLGFMAVTAVNVDIDISDLERCKGADVVTFMRLGRNFFKTTSEDSSSPDSSDDTSEATPEPSTLRSETSSADV